MARCPSGNRGGTTIKLQFGKKFSQRTENLRASQSITTLFAIFLAAAPLTHTVSALNPESRVSQYGHTVWRVQDGVLSSSVTAFAQTADGYLWIGTQNGLYRFDGVNFQAWNPPTGEGYPSGVASIRSLYAGKDGSLWIGTSAGLARWTNGKFTSVAAPNAAIETIAEDDKNTVWITRANLHAFTGPICKVSTGSEQCLGESAGIRTTSAGSMVSDGRGHFWIGGNGSLIEWDGRLLGEHPLPGESQSNASRMVEGVALDADGSVWVGEDATGPGKGLQRFSNGSWHAFAAPGFNGANVSVRTLFLDRDHCLWVGTDTQGIYRIHGQSVDHLGHESGLSSNSIYKIFQDREGGVWVATGEGLDHFRDLPVVTYSSMEGLSTETVNAVLARRDGSVIVSTTSSLDLIQGSTVTPERMAPGLQGNSPAIFEDHAGNLWIGRGDGGLAVEINGQLHSVFKGSDGVIPSFAEDTDHSVWAVINGPHPRLIRVQDLQVRQEFKPPEFPRAAYCVVADPQGGVWVSLLSGGLLRFRNGQWQELSMDPLVKKYSRVGGIFNMSVDSEGTLWGAANSGVVAYRQGNLQFLNERNGLPCRATYAIITDLHGDLWIQAECGLVRIKRSEVERWWRSPETRLQVSTFTAADGFMPGIPYSHPAAVRGSDGRLWFQNRSVVMMVDPDHLPMNIVVPPVHVEQVIADRRIYGAQNDLRLPPKTRELEVDYAGLSFVAPSKVLFRYMLEGYDTQWQEPGTRRAAFYNNLPPGNYRFRVIASNDSGVWNTEGASLRFDISPAYYQTYWFRMLSVIALVGLLWALYRLWLRQMQQKFNIALEARVNERTRIARELHDTLLQSLHGLMFQFQAARNMLPRNPEDARRTLDEAIIETEQTITESRDAIEDLRSRPASEGDLAALLEIAGEELMEVHREDQISPSFRVIIEGDPRKLSPELQDEVYRISHELLRNAFWHAGASQIEVEIRYDASQLRVRIRDDGKGIDPKVLEASRRPGHWGLPGVRERAQGIGARLGVWSQNGAGTEVELAMPAAVAYEGAQNGRVLQLFRREQKL